MLKKIAFIMASETTDVINSGIYLGGKIKNYKVIEDDQLSTPFPKYDVQAAVSRVSACYFYLEASQAVVEISSGLAIEPSDLCKV
jgi:hypothetical protein